MRDFQEGEIPLFLLSDGLVIQHILEGNEQAFEVLIDRYGSSLFRYITSRLRDYDASCDVLQQVLLQLYLSLPSLKRDSPLKPWLWQVTHHKLIDEVRRKRWISLSNLDYTEGETALLLLPDPTLLPEEQVEYQELQHEVQKAIATLPARYQQIVILRYLTQWPFSKISRFLAIPQATAKTYFQRAMPLLRAALQAQDITQRSVARRSKEIPPSVQL